MIWRLGKIYLKNINTHIYVYCSQKTYKVQFKTVTRFLITQSRSTFRGRLAVPDAEVISEKDIPKPRGWKPNLI